MPKGIRRPLVVLQSRGLLRQIGITESESNSANWNDPPKFTLLEHLKYRLSRWPWRLEAQPTSIDGIAVERGMGMYQETSANARITPKEDVTGLTRRKVLRLLAASALATQFEPLAQAMRAGRSRQEGPAKELPAVPEEVGGAGLDKEQERFLMEMEAAGCLYFWEQASDVTGQVRDRALADGEENQKLQRRTASIAATGFGLTCLCIADQNGFLPGKPIAERVKTTLRFLLSKMPENHGFFYHFSDMETGATLPGTELSSIDTAILICGVLTARAHFFNDPQIKRMATQIYQRVDWPWMLNHGKTFSMGWLPQSGFLQTNWDTYSELMMIYLLAIGSPTHPVSPMLWNNFRRTTMKYGGFDFISGDAPLFTHQYSQAWFDFRKRRDQYTDYFENSVTTTKAHEAFCLAARSRFRDYSKDFWGVTASDSEHGYTAWGGSPVMGKLDGTMVPAATGGSLPFLPHDCLRVLMYTRRKYGSKAWKHYGFIDALNPRTHWFDQDVLGIDLGISVIMAENLRTGFVWDTFMQNREVVAAMDKAGLKEMDTETPRLPSRKHAVNKGA